MPFPMPSKNPQTEAINRTMQAQTPVPAQKPQGGAPSSQPGQPGGDPPVVVAIKMLDRHAMKSGILRDFAFHTSLEQRIGTHALGSSTNVAVSAFRRKALKPFSAATPSAA